MVSPDARSLNVLSVDALSIVVKGIVQSNTTQQSYPLLFATISGSHLYGFPSKDSDYDLRGVHILPLRDIVGLHQGEDTVEALSQQQDIELDLVTHDVKKFFSLLLKRNGYVLEQLYSPLVVYTTPEHEELKAIAPHCITRHHSHHYLGFAKTQWGLFAKNVTTAESPPIKPLLYIYRVLLTGIYLMKTGMIEANLEILHHHLHSELHTPYLPDLLEQKRSGQEHSAVNGANIDFHYNEYCRLVQVLEAARDASSLPDAPSAKAALHDLLLQIRLETNHH